VLESAVGAGPVQLEPEIWLELQARHEAAVDDLTRDHLARTAAAQTHPVEDFLFTYYRLRPSQLRRWHPGAGTALLDAGERSGWRFHRTFAAGTTRDRTAVVADPQEFLRARRSTVSFIARLLAGTQAATPQFGCFGLHEWAMVYRADDRRHPGYPLRLGRAGTDAVVDQHPLRCSHFDAARFFPPEASGKNLLLPERDTREEMEQPGCLHASMDLYKWAYRLLPIVSSSTLLDCFRLARDVRAVDMRASPYDFSELGYSPIPIETAAGKGAYVAEQRVFARRGQVLRARLRDEISRAVPDLGSEAGQERRIDESPPFRGARQQNSR
jgi:hypothetical protein